MDKLSKKESNARWAAANPEKVAASRKKWLENNKEKRKEVSANWRAKNPGYLSAYYQANKEKALENQRAWRAANPGRESPGVARWRKVNPEKCAEYYARWAKNNRDICNALTAKRQAAKIAATPSWSDDFVIKEIYDLASLRTRITGIAWHVDHIVPLRSKLVCGLHCEFNLGVVTGKSNVSKGNRFWPDMP